MTAENISQNGTEVLQDVLPVSESPVQGEGPVVHIDMFDGPLDLLWDLIRRSRIDITEISMSDITEQYISYLKLMEKMNVRIASEFIWMASELLYYKSRAVLPHPDVEDEDFVPPMSPEIIQKLFEYKKFQQAALSFKSTYDVQADVYTRTTVHPDLDGETGYIEASLFDLLKAFSNVMNSTVTVEKREIVFDEVLVSERMSHILSLLKDRESFIFTEMFSRIPTRAEVIASFLAVLEMTKAEMIKVLQHQAFGDIKVIRRFTSDEIPQISETVN